MAKNEQAKNECLLCVKDLPAENYKKLCDEFGQYNEVYFVTVKYFDSMIFNMAQANGPKIICLDCWRHIIEFHNFQKSVLEIQERLRSHVNESIINANISIKTEHPDISSEKCIIESDNNELLYGYIVKEEVEFTSPLETFQTEVNRTSNNNILLSDEQELRSLATSSKIPYMNYTTKFDRGTSTLQSEIQKFSNAATSEDTHDNDGNIKDLVAATGTIKETEHDDDDLMDISETELNSLDVYDSFDDNEMMHESESTKVVLPIKQMKGKTSIVKSQNEKKAQEPCSNKIKKQPVKRLPTKRLLKCKREEELDDVIAQWKPKLDCIKCKKSFISYTLLQQHWREEHQNQEFYIKCCDIKIKKRGQLAEHIRLHINNKAFKCPYCERRCNRQRNLRAHMLNKHGISEAVVIPLTDSKSKKNTGTEINIDDSDDFIAQWLPNLECVLCKSAWPSYTHLQEHYNKNHPKDECYILCCDYKLNTRSLIAKHLVQYTHPRAYKCEYCEGCFTMKRSLDSHIRKEHSHNDNDSIMSDKSCDSSGKVDNMESDAMIAQWFSSKLECAICKQVYSTFTSLRQHFTQMHPQEKGCYVMCCQRKFGKRYRLVDHVRKHLNAKAFKCELCGKRYSRQDGLDTHMGKQHYGIGSKYEENTIDSVEEECSDNISKMELQTNPSNKRKSIKELDEIIAKWRPNLECFVCHELYSTFTLLQEHFRDKHPDTGCHITCCRSKFVGRYDIEEHIRYHNDPNAFKCEKCGRCFARRRSLIGHMRTHRG